MNQTLQLLLIASICIVVIQADEKTDLLKTQTLLEGKFKKQLKQCFSDTCKDESCITNVNLKGYCLIDLCIDSSNYKDPKTLIDCVPLKIDDSTCNSGMDDAQKQAFNKCFNQEKSTFKTLLSNFNIEVENQKSLLFSAFVNEVSDCLSEKCNNDQTCISGAYDKGSCLIDLCTNANNQDDAKAIGNCLGSKIDDTGCNAGLSDTSKVSLTSCIREAASFSKIIGLCLMTVALLLMI